MLKNINRYLKKLYSDLRKHQDKITYDLDHLFDEVNKEDYYESKEIRSAFNGNYTLYESRRDKDNMLAIY